MLHKLWGGPPDPLLAEIKCFLTSVTGRRGRRPADQGSAPQIHAGFGSGDFAPAAQPADHRGVPDLQ